MYHNCALFENKLAERCLEDVQLYQKMSEHSNQHFTKRWRWNYLML